MKINYSRSNDQSTTITTAMFGGNELFKYDIVTGEAATYPEATDLLGVAGLRYPGGTMTEINFDVSHPNSGPVGANPSQPYIGVSDFLNFAQSTDRPVDMVLPTRGMYSGTADQFGDTPREINETYFQSVLNYVKLLLTSGDQGTDALPDTSISTFEIGNEYWGGGAMTAKEYGQIVNTLIPALEAVFDEMLGDALPHPGILVQMGSPLDPQYQTGIYSALSYSDRLSQCNQDIIGAISDPEAAAGITGLVRHYYYSGVGDSLVQNTWSMNSIDSNIAQWNSAGFADRDLFITEWNVNFTNNAQLGLKAASIVVEQMSYMVSLGADAAFAWPVQGYSNGLVDNSDDTISLSPNGAAFKLMAESIVGTHMLSYELEGGPLQIHSFGSDTKIVLFISSRSQDSQSVDLDVRNLVSGFSEVDGVKIGIAPGEAVNDPNSHAILSYYEGADLFQWGALKFDLAPFEVMRVEFQIPAGENYIGTSASDRILGGLGCDTLSGELGNDVISGSGGLDILYGGVGRDKIASGAGDDWVSGGDGNDRLASGSGADTLDGDAGNDILTGGIDSSALYGGDGDDFIKGLAGSDTISGGMGFDTLSGGSGSDHFLFDSPFGSDSGVDTILDMELGVDKIVVDHDIFIGFSVGALQSENFSVGAATNFRSVEVGIAYDNTTGYLYYDANGNGLDDSDLAFARVAPGLQLSAVDFLVC